MLQDLTTFAGAASENVTLTGASVERTYNFTAGFSSTNMGLALQMGGFGSGERKRIPRLRMRRGCCGEALPKMRRLRLHT